MQSQKQKQKIRTPLYGYETVSEFKSEGVTSLSDSRQLSGAYFSHEFLSFFSKRLEILLSKISDNWFR